MNKVSMKILAVLILSVLVQPCHLFAAEKVFYYHTDQAGTPLAMTDESGTVVWKADYKPFGEEQSINPATIENNQKFVGKTKDIETGLYYFDARYMLNQIGRFMSPDPVGPIDPMTGKINMEILLNPQRLNPYAYALNNPYRYVDPDGRVVEIIGSTTEKKIIQRDISKLKEKSATGKSVIEKLEGSKEIIRIQITDSGNSYAPGENIIEYNPNKDRIYSGNEKWHHRAPEIGLGHEAIHSLHDIEGRMGSTRDVEESKTVGLGKYANEPHTENKIRGEYGIERRPRY